MRVVDYLRNDDAEVDTFTALPEFTPAYHAVCMMPGLPGILDLLAPEST